MLRARLDFVSACAVVHEMPGPGPFFNDAARAMKPGASLLLAEPAGHVDEAEFAAELDAAAQEGLAVVARHCCASRPPDDFCCIMSLPPISLDAPFRWRRRMTLGAGRLCQLRRIWHADAGLARDGRPRGGSPCVWAEPRTERTHANLVSKRHSCRSRAGTDRRVDQLPPPARPPADKCSISSDYRPIAGTW
jgi:hypothetical protein